MKGSTFKRTLPSGKIDWCLNVWDVSVLEIEMFYW
jgi:hypothetical protein